MKRIIIFILTILVVVISYIFLFNRKISYELSYDINDYNLAESFDIKSNYYTFSVEVDNLKYNFMSDKKYSTKRKLVSDVLAEDVNDYKCVSLKVDETFLPPICSKDDKFYDSYIAGLNKKNSEHKINTVNEIDVYSKDYDYYIWNGYGLTNVLTQKKYNFLNNEHYENDISYRIGKYLVFADYDSSREFNKLYIFDSEKQEILYFNFEYNISTDCYFNGHIDDDLYLFDRKNKVQYKINIKKKKISVSSTKDYAISYDGDKDEVALADFTYSNVLFNYTNFINFKIKDNKLYYKYYNNHDEILINNEIKDIIYSEDRKVFYIVNDSLYVYNLETGGYKLLTYFEWNFNYKNKIYIF